MKIVGFMPPQPRRGTLHNICLNHKSPLFFKKYGKEGEKIICECGLEIEPHYFEPFDPDEDVDAT